MNGALALFNFSYGFTLALLREWFYPVLFLVAIGLAIMFTVMVIRVAGEIRKRWSK